MLFPGTINNLCFVLTFMITLKYFKCDTSTCLLLDNRLFMLTLQCDKFCFIYYCITVTLFAANKSGLVFTASETAKAYLTAVDMILI